VKEMIMLLFLSVKAFTQLTVESVTCVTRRTCQLAVGGMRELWVGSYHILLRVDWRRGRWVTSATRWV
jgi:hypothetical protein